MLIILLSIIVSASSCKGKYNSHSSKDSTVISISPSGEYAVRIFDSSSKVLVDEFYLDRNKKLNGTYTTFSASGRRRSESHYLHGLLDGKKLSWYEDGQISSDENYSNNLLEGVRIFYNTDTSILSCELYHRGVMIKNLNSENDRKEEGKLIYKSFLESGLDSVSALNAMKDVVFNRDSGGGR